MPILIKPSGAEVFVSPESLAHALSMGWRPKPEEVKQEAKRSKSSKSA
jgi:hypothetical protein